MGEYADPECNDSQVQYYSQINERKEAYEKWVSSQQNQQSPLDRTGAPITPYIPFWMGIPGSPQINPYLPWLQGLLPYVDFYSYSVQITDALDFISNNGIPLYKQTKGSLPGGPFLEASLGFGTQLVGDMNDRSRIYSPSDLLNRAVTAGIEDGITEVVATPVGVSLGEIGAGCGPAAPACMAVLYLAGSNGMTWIMDNIVWKPINAEYNFYR